MKLIAYYLPQFHEIPENDEWWGKGFTEWVNVKKAKPLFKGHQQPRKPLNNNYYDLSEKSTMEWQTELMHNYNVFGLCYYHYWFSGKKLLEKPAENLLKFKDIPQNFCFCWANATWRKTWTKGNEILLEQKYGGREEWDAHLDYLLPFFKDERYIKTDNKPIFVILNMCLVPDVKERFAYYDEYCKKHGFAGIELVQSINGRFQEIFDFVPAITLREPSITHSSINSFFKKIIIHLKKNKKFNLFCKPLLYKWENIAKESLRYANTFETDKRIYLGSFKEWDSTSRHGKHGYVITKPTPNQFEEYMSSIKEITTTKKNVSDYIFFTAWNEWCECCYLEPDTENGVEYLDVVKRCCENG